MRLEISEHPALREARTFAHRLTAPRTYWKGKSTSPPLQPSNILVFSRTHARSLLGHHPDQHHRFVLVCSLTGEGTVGIEDRFHALGPGQSLLIFPFQPHLYSGLQDTLAWVFVTFECARGTALEAMRNRGVRDLRESTLLHLTHLLRAWHSPARLPTLALHLGLWLHDMIRSEKSRRAEPRHLHQDRGARAGWVERVNQILFQNRHRPLSLDHLASAVGCSTSLLRKRFQETTGRSLGRHAREIRLSHACELLHDTDLRIEEIAGRCGYASLFAFSRAFRTAYGLSPSGYRLRQQSPSVRRAAGGRGRPSANGAGARQRK